MIVATNRIFAIDSAKGLGIILVVFGHAWRGAQSADLFADQSLFHLIDRAIYAFHMELFFFLSGLLFLDRLQKYPTGQLLWGRVKRLLWPMALWSWVFFGFKLLAGSSANTPVALADFPLIPLPPYEYLWFLWALFLIQGSVIVIFGVFAGSQSPRRIRWLVGAVAVGLGMIHPWLSVTSVLLGPMVAHFPFFLSGMAAGAYVMWRPSRGGALVAGAAFAGLVVISALYGATVPLSLLMVLFASAGWAYIDQNSPLPHPVVRVLRYLGQASMVIYLSHVIFTAALRIVLMKLGWADLGLVVVTTTAVGLLGPLALLALAQRFRLAKLLGF